MTAPASSYEGWTREDLIARLTQLDSPKVQNPSQVQPGPVRPPKPFNFSSFSRRKIALKFCYSGWEYNGLAFQLGPTPLPTVEGTLFEALAQARLIDPGAGFEGCEWERCGRTDRGVSAAGQVVSLWVRSALGGDEPEDVDMDVSPKDRNTVQNNSPPRAKREEESANISALDGDLAFMDDLSDSDSPYSPPLPGKKTSEHRYVSILNRILPPTIRVLAWSPVSPTFSARFACGHRHYKYFFSPDGLDINLMRNAAMRLVGEHDFRNLCKLDATKQITSFKRKILRADISSVDGRDGGDDSNMHVLDLIGTAFLYHQVRHIMAILFLVGTGLEHPSVVSSLLNVELELEQPWKGEPPLEVVDCKPDYQMADALPLMLWECAYAENDVLWRTNGDDDGGEGEDLADTSSGLYHQLHSIHARSVMHSTLDAQFLSAAAAFHSPPQRHFPLSLTGFTPSAKFDGQGVMCIPLGGGTFKRTSKYVPLLKRNRLDNVAVANERWRVGKGFRRDERRKAEAREDGDE